jgi:ABC-2 type transport system ATP-binding protein
VAYLPGELRLYENFTCRQLVHFLSRLRGRPPRAEVAELARRFDVDLDRPLSHLSSGMKRKVALLQVLVAHAGLIIMDEPTNTLDPTMRDELLHHVRKARDRGQAVIFSSHVLSEVEQVCDRVAILQGGRLVHLQAMAPLRDGRRVVVRLRDGVADLPHLEGLTLRERLGNRLVMEYTGELSRLLSWLADQPLADVRLEPLGLQGIYHDYHPAEA